MRHRFHFSLVPRLASSPLIDQRAGGSQAQRFQAAVRILSLLPLCSFGVLRMLFGVSSPRLVKKWGWGVVWREELEGAVLREA